MENNTSFLALPLSTQGLFYRVRALVEAAGGSIGCGGPARLAALLQAHPRVVARGLADLLRLGFVRITGQVLWCDLSPSSVRVESELSPRKEAKVPKTRSPIPAQDSPVPVSKRLSQTEQGEDSEPVVTFGAARGRKVSQIPKRMVLWYRTQLELGLANPAKAAFHEHDRKILRLLTPLPPEEPAFPPPLVLPDGPVGELCGLLRAQGSPDHVVGLVARCRLTAAGLEAHDRFTADWLTENLGPRFAMSGRPVTFVAQSMAA